MYEENNLRISLKFSEKDRDQVEIANLLKQKGRKKSAFITEAIIFYLQNSEDVLPERTTIRGIVKEVLTEIGYDNNAKQKTPKEPFENMRYLTPEENKKKMDAYRKMSTPVKGADFNKLQKELPDEKFEDSYFDTNSQENDKVPALKDDKISSVTDDELQDLLGSLDLFGGWYMSLKLSESQFKNLVGNKQQVCKIKKNKYKNKKIKFNGITYDSKNELLRHLDLLKQEKLNLISSLSYHKKKDEIVLLSDPVIKYIPDFCYFENGYFIIEDFKGFQTKEFKLKKKLLISLLRKSSINTKFRLVKIKNNHFVVFEEYIFLAKM